MTKKSLRGMRATSRERGASKTHHYLIEGERRGSSTRDAIECHGPTVGPCQVIKASQAEKGDSETNYDK